MVKIVKEEVTMLQIQDTLISLDLLDEYFMCKLDKCQGKCCVLGDAGAPLTKKEIKIITKELKKISKYITEAGKKTIQKDGVYTIDDSGEFVTTLIDNKECAFVCFEDGIAKCAIEKAWENNEIDFKKPISCHLYPVRIQKYNTFTAVNYDRWTICEHARIAGKNSNLPLYVFLKDPLIRRFGNDWYNELLLAANSLKEQNNK